MSADARRPAVPEPEDAVHEPWDPSASPAHGGGPPDPASGGSQAAPQPPFLLEGSTRIAAPAVNVHPRGPGRREKGQAFYNPGMAVNRDLSVLIAEAEGLRKGREIDFADVLAGTGARSVRVAAECGARLIVHANDGNPAAVAAIRATAQANGVASPRLEVSGSDAAVFLARRRFDVVDVDPHGSPMPFLDAAVRATRPDGLVCVTATDTGALAGTFPRVARRRYDAHHGLGRMPWKAEVGLRILASAVVRAAARSERGATPVLGVSQGHWMRVVARVEEGSGKADAALRHLRAAVADPETGSGRFLEAHEPPPAATAWAGPLWAGPLHEEAFVASLRDAHGGKALARPRDTDALLGLLLLECGAPPFWVVPDLLQRRFGPPPRRDELVARLQARGLKASRSHLDPQGVRTAATAAELASCWAAP